MDVWLHEERSRVFAQQTLFHLHRFNRSRTSVEIQGAVEIDWCRVLNKSRDARLLLVRTPPGCVLDVLHYRRHLGLSRWRLFSFHLYVTARPATKAPVTALLLTGSSLHGGPQCSPTANNAHTATSVAPGAQTTCQPGTLRIARGWRCTAGVCLDGMMDFLTGWHAHRAPCSDSVTFLTARLVGGSIFSILSMQRGALRGKECDGSMLPSSTEKALANSHFGTTVSYEDHATSMHSSLQGKTEVCVCVC